VLLSTCIHRRLRSYQRNCLLLGSLNVSETHRHLIVVFTVNDSGGGPNARCSTRMVDRGNLWQAEGPWRAAKVLVANRGL